MSGGLWKHLWRRRIAELSTSVGQGFAGCQSQGRGAPGWLGRGVLLTGTLGPLSVCPGAALVLLGAGPALRVLRTAALLPGHLVHGTAAATVVVLVSLTVPWLPGSWTRRLLSRVRPFLLALKLNTQTKF